MRRRLQGSISLLLALIIPLMSLLFILGLAYGERRLREADFARAVTAAAEKSMASYDRGLWRDFGLWGVEESEMHLEECFELAPHAQITYALQNTKKTLEKDEIKRQILRFMRLRGPAFLALDLEKRMRSALDGRQTLSGGKLETSLREAHRRLEAEKNYEAGREGINLLNQKRLGSGKKWQNDEPSESEGSNSSDGKNQGMSELSSKQKGFIENLLFSFNKDMLPVYHALGSEDVKPDEVFSPSCIEGLAGKMDLLLDRGLGMDAERLSLAEYILRFFPAALWTEHDALHFRRLRTPDGRLLGDLAKERPLEVEQIITGLNVPKLAENRCEMILTGLRFLPQMLAASQSPSRQAT